MPVDGSVVSLLRPSFGVSLFGSVFEHGLADFRTTSANTPRKAHKSLRTKRIFHGKCLPLRPVKSYISAL
jgi:hypothetical protein